MTIEALGIFDFKNTTGYIPGGGILTASIADLIQSTTNRYTGVFVTAPMLVTLEQNALAWLCEFMGYPKTAGGVFSSGGSMANFNAVICARERYLGANLRKGTLYFSSHVHHCVQKCARLAGSMCV